MDTLLETLSAIERAEARLLVWGLVDGALTDDELLQLIQNDLVRQVGVGNEEAAALDPEDVLDELLRRVLVVRAPEQPGRYRSRMAETVRLLARLRQLFPKHAHGGWLTAPRLVADFRMALRPRRYPTRDIDPGDAVEILRSRLGNLAPDLERCLRATLADRGTGFALSSFQVDAAEAILSALRDGSGGATVVTAGTGSGKTLAFYLPVMATLASSGGVRGPQAIAIYPRNELLKDQLSQSYIEARRLDGVTASGRQLSIGAFFGPTPHDHEARSDWMSRAGWLRYGDGYICPFLRCPRQGCSGPLVWQDSDRARSEECLRCAAPECDVVTTAQTLPLTRKRMRQTPPDILFTSTEMLNRNLSSWEHRRLLGLDPPHPRVALIDEAHTYSGVSGAQSAMLLRRWHAAVGGRVHFVGLSATLVDAADFFARLTGVRDDTVTLVDPTEYDEEGMEYQLVLRGDPASGASLLSTTIQAAMALRRMLDPLGHDISHGAYGEKIFAFTDDLDVTNRLYHALRDAEGLGPYGRQRKPGGTPLATLRSTQAADADARRRDAQAWDVAERLGHDLSGQTLLDISRTSSQDAGVSERSDAIVATSSLEVGFNDPGVGGIIQHKAPRDDAAFLQRRGRAGRTREMRPWTVVTLSDFGRDRLAYEAYDTLFDPALTARPLPTSNRAVVRMQATYAWMDWCARRLAPTDPAGSVWRDLAGPGTHVSVRRRQAALSALIVQTLEDSATADDLATHLRRALGLSREQVDAVLWEPPRALMTEVLPTARRRLESGWFDATHPGSGEGGDFRARYDPLPDFVPSNLFSELTLPEVHVVTPPQNRKADEEEHSVSLLQAMRTFAPGNVSLRFAIERRGARSWVEPPEGPTAPLEAFIEHPEPLGAFSYSDADGVHNIPVFLPRRLRSVPVPMDVTDSSSGRLAWHTQIHAGSNPHLIATSQGSPWQPLVGPVEFHTHGRHGPARVRRFATGGEFSTMRRSGTEAEGRYNFSAQGAPAAIGFELDVDGFAVHLHLPSNCAPSSDVPSARLRGFRSALFAHRLASDRSLDGRVNPFKRSQVEQVYVAALVDRALRDGISLREAWTALHTGDVHGALAQAAHALFDIAVPASDAQNADDERLGLDRLIDLLADKDVVDALSQAAVALWEDPTPEWEAVARARMRATIAAAVSAACSALCPEFSSDEVVVDLDAGAQPDGDDGDDAIWVTERVVGGGGVIEEIHRRCAEHPRRFFTLLSRVLDPGDFEVVDTEMPKVVALACQDGRVSKALHALRDAGSHYERERAVTEMVGSLRGEGLDTRHAVIAAVNSRLVRPGSTPQTDERFSGIVDAWHGAELAVGIDIDARTFAFHCRDRPEFDDALPEAQGAGSSWRFGQMLGLMWPHGWRARAGALQIYNEFAPHPPSDRLAMATQTAPTTRMITLSGAWAEELEVALIADGAATLVCAATAYEALAEALAGLGTRPIDTGALLLFPWIEGVRQVDAYIHVSVAIEAPAS